MPTLNKKSLTRTSEVISNSERVIAIRAQMLVALLRSDENYYYDGLAQATQDAEVLTNYVITGNVLEEE